MDTRRRILFLVLVAGFFGLARAQEAAPAPAAAGGDAEVDKQVRIYKTTLLEGKDAQTRLDAATLLLFNGNGEARAEVLAVLGDTGHPEARAAICKALTVAREDRLGIPGRLGPRGEVVQGLDPTAMDAETVLKMATMGGAKTLGLEGEIGSLAVGKQADIVIIDAHQPHLLPLYNPVSQLVYSARGSDVRDVMVAGRLLMKNRKLLTLEWPEIAQRVTAVGGRIGNDYKPPPKGI